MTTFVEQLARRLECELGPCPARRDQLIEWIDDQLNRCSRLGVPGEAALAMINSGYVEWCALLLERDQPTEDQIREPLDMKISGDFDAEDPEINAMFEGDRDAKGD